MAYFSCMLYTSIKAYVLQNNFTSLNVLYDLRNETFLSSDDDQEFMYVEDVWSHWLISPQETTLWGWPTGSHVMDSVTGYRYIGNLVWHCTHGQGQRLTCELCTVNNQTTDYLCLRVLYSFVSTRFILFLHKQFVNFLRFLVYRDSCINVHMFQGFIYKPVFRIVFVENALV